MGARKVSFANAEQTRELTGMEIGGVTIFGLPDDLPVWIDAGVLAHDWIVVGAGSRSAKIRLDARQLEGLNGYEIVPDLGREVSA
jgi:prolyl-tRNA editing enzyme YbaK/EbsC (Cys-tRNA(Pro) deacylase)